MLGYVLIFFLGKWFYDLAKKFDKSKWLFALLGIAVYYAGTFLAGIIIGLLAVAFDFYAILELPDVALGLIALPFGLLAAWGFRKILIQNWQKKVIVDDQLLDDTTTLDI